MPENDRIATHRPEVFEVTSLDQAKNVIVTPEPGTTTEERWQKETAYLVTDIPKYLTLGPDTCVLDYGCGVGRIARELVRHTGCRVVGVDESKAMRLLAPEYVLSERFTVWSPQVLDKMIAGGFRADAGVCLWVIQHVLDPRAVVERLARALRPGALLYCLNQKTRCVPTDKGWVNDGFDVWQCLREVFHEEESHRLSESATTALLSSFSMIQLLRNRH